MKAERRRTDQVRRCAVCSRELPTAGDIGWECDCGALVCPDPDCFDECFKHVAEGEATRCRLCGALT